VDHHSLQARFGLKAFASQHFSTVAAPPFQQVSIAR